MLVVVDASLPRNCSHFHHFFSTKVIFQLFNRAHMILQTLCEKVTNLLRFVFDWFVFEPYVFPNLSNFVSNWLAFYNLIKLLLSELKVILALKTNHSKLISIFSFDSRFLYLISNFMINPWFRMLAYLESVLGQTISGKFLYWISW